MVSNVSLILQQDSNYSVSSKGINGNLRGTQSNSLSNAVQEMRDTMSSRQEYSGSVTTSFTSFIGGSSSSSSSNSSGSIIQNTGTGSSSNNNMIMNTNVIMDESRKLRKAIEDQSRHLSSQRAFSDLIMQLISSGYDLLSQTDLKHKIVGIAVLDCLLDVELRNDDLQGRRQAIANRLKLETFENSKINLDNGGVLVLRAAALLVGHLARIANPSETEYLYQFLFMWAFDQLKRGRQFKLAGALLVTQIANNSPNLVFKHHKDNKSSSMGMSTWDVVCDRVPVVREAAAEALEACLQVISAREPMDQYLTAAFTQIDAGFAANSTEKVIGSLLICDIIVAGNVVSNDGLHASMKKAGKDFSQFVYRILQLFTEPRQAGAHCDVRLKAIEIVPKLASAFSHTFLQPNQLTNPHNFLSFTINHLITLIYAKSKTRDDRERSLAYIALGKIVAAMSSSLRQSQQMADIFRTIREGFHDQYFCISALQCLAMVISSSQSIRKFVDRDTVECMFRGGLTYDLIECLKAVTRHVSSVSSWVQSQLLYHSKSILRSYAVTVDDGPRSGRMAPSRALGAVSGNSSSSSAFSSNSQVSVRASPAKQWLNPFSLRHHETLTPVQARNSEALLVLSLQVLASSDFFKKKLRNTGQASTDAEEHTGVVALLRVTQEAVLRYLDDYNAVIRGAAVQTCAKVLDTVILCIDPLSAEYPVLFQVVDRLLMVGVGDDLVDIRLQVFKSLAPSLDRLISQSENVHCLIEALNDESVEVRVAAMRVFARVAQHNTLFFMPMIRVLIERFVRQLLNTSDHVSRSEAAQLLQALVHGANKLIIPYLDILIDPLMALLDDPSPFITRTALSTIGDLSVASPESMKNHLDSLFLHLIDALDEEKSSVATQEAAVEAMGKLVSSLTMVTEEPYSRYPGLFEGLVGIIHKENAPELRLKAIRTAGLLGAVDASVYQTQLRNFTGVVENAGLGQAGDEDDEVDALEGQGATDEQVNTTKMTKLEKYYLAVVMKSLMNILRNSDLSPTHHKSAAYSAINILRIIGAQAKPVLANVFDGLRLRIEHPDTEALFRDTLLDHLKSLVFILGRGVRKYTASIVALVSEKLPGSNHTLFENHLRACLDLVESFGIKLSKPDFSLVLHSVVPIMMDIMISEPHADWMLGDDAARTSSLADSVLHGQAAIITMGAGSSRQPTKSAFTTSASTFTERQGRKLPLPKTAKILQTVANMSDNLGDYKRVFIPAVIRILDEKDTAENVRREALATLMHLANDRGNVYEFASRIMHPLMRIVGASEPTLQKAALTALSCLVVRLGTEYVSYIVPVRRKLKSLFVTETHPCTAHLEEYESLVNLLLKQRQLPSVVSTQSDIAVKTDGHVRAESVRELPKSSFKLDPASLEQAWALAGRNSSTDLEKWMRRLSLELIRQSPSAIIRGCADIAKTHQPLAEELFNISFNCMWDELNEADSSVVLHDSTLIRSIELALWSKNTTEKITNSLLHLSEFMDMQDKSLPLDVRLLGKRSEDANMYAKSLRYRELESNSAYIPPSGECIEALITVNNQLGLEDRAAGVLKTVINLYPSITIEPLWLEKLSRWDDARISYLEENAKHDGPMVDTIRNPQKMASELGVLRCLYALGEYDELALNATRLKDKLSLRDSFEENSPWLTQVQKLGANAAWMLSRWDLMESCLTVEGEVAEEPQVIELDKNLSFYRTIIAIHKSDYQAALGMISDSRAKLSGTISSLLSEGYSRAYRAMVTMQILAELEEVIEFKQYATMAMSVDPLSLAQSSNARHRSMSSRNSFQLHSADIYIPRSPSGGHLEVSLNSHIVSTGHSVQDDLAARKAALIRKWRGRLKWAPKEVDVYRQMIAVHTLVAEPAENLDSWLELVTLCRKEGMYSLCENILRRLGAPVDPKPTQSPAESSQESVIEMLLDSPRGDISHPVSSPDGDTPPRTPEQPSPEQVPFNQSGVSKRVLFCYHKFLWHSGDKARALRELTEFIKIMDPIPPVNSLQGNYRDRDSMFLDGRLGVRSGHAPSFSSYEGNASRLGGLNDLVTFRVRCLLKRAEWMREVEDEDDDMLQTVFEARELASDHYSVWHAWAVTNYDQLKKVTESAQNEDDVFTLSSEAASISTDDLTLNTRSYGSHSHTFNAATGSPLLFTSRKESYQLGNTGSPIKLRKVHSLSKLNIAGLGSSTLGPGRKHNITNEDKIIKYVVEAIKGFVRSIILGQGQPVANVLQDTLRLLTLWFTYGVKEGVSKIAEAEIIQVAPENWLDVVPQLIARMHIKTKEISNLLGRLLAQVASVHPQALVCPISVALNTSIEQQKKMAARVLHEMRMKNPQLVLEATMVSRELLLVATSPDELWCDGLEKAAALYNGKGDGKESHASRVEQMMKTLTEMHEAMNMTAEADTAAAEFSLPYSPGHSSGNTSAVLESEEKGFTEAICTIGLSTLRDISFRHAYGKRLAEAQEFLETYRRTQSTTALHQAWDVYYQLFQKWRKKQLSGAPNKFELHHVSRALTNAKNLRLSVPGTYRPNAPVVSITEFSNTVEVIASKQRPRRMAMLGSDGTKYEFLLKGKEDLRQDERVMQLFGLINICLDNDRSTANRGLNITRYSVLPLSNNSGVIGWVHQCDTINSLIKQYRLDRGFPHEFIERTLIRIKAGIPKSEKTLNLYHRLPLINKLDVFTQVLDSTSGEDLAKVLWLRSKTADVWVERRASFTKSMAVMSMVGYILGLGDRHLANLMLHRVSGRVVHIDFGDCFEVTKNRKDLPEIIPFRLTRMLTKCMGASGIEGTYKATAYRVSLSYSHPSILGSWPLTHPTLLSITHNYRSCVSFAITEIPLWRC